jgi:hypothetical protein
VAAGNDTPEYLAIHFVSKSDVEDIKAIHRAARLEVLVQPPPGSQMYASWASLGRRENFHGITPRAPSAAEAEYIGKIRGLQVRIRKYMGSRPMSDWNAEDMQKFLMENFGAGCGKEYRLCYDAVDAMDRGVRVPGKR